MLLILQGHLHNVLAENLLKGNYQMAEFLSVGASVFVTAH